MRHNFPYIKTGLWYRPIIPISLKYNKKELNYLALLDSGADFNILHGEIAKILGIDLTKLKSIKFQGIKEGSEGIGYITEIEVGINHAFHKTMVVFSNDISENGYGILGQQGFFNNYKAHFLYRDREVVLEDEEQLGKN